MARRILDFLYAAAERAAALFLFSIFAVVCLQIGARWIGVSFPGAANYAGYALAAASFLALAPALNRGAHIRVGLLLRALPPSRRRWGEAFCLGVAAVVCVGFAAAAIRAALWSAKINDISQGQDATPLWIPQSAMGAGATLLAVALVDNFARVVRRGEWPGQSGDKAR